MHSNRTPRFLRTLPALVASMAMLAALVPGIGQAASAPVAVADSYTAYEDMILEMSGASGLLANDTDPDGDPLTAALVNGPAYGTVTLSANGDFTYIPLPNYYGMDSFVYQVTDSTGMPSTPAVVSLTVIPVNDAPQAMWDAYTIEEDTTLTVRMPGLLMNDVDVDGDYLFANLVIPPSNGTLTLNFDGSFVYTPAPNFWGTDSFAYRAHDGVLESNMATVTLHVAPVNDAPMALPTSYSLAEDFAMVVSAPGVLSNAIDVDGDALTAAAPGLLANDSDIDGDMLAAALVNGPSQGTVTLNTDGSFVYVPSPNFYGTDSFTYQVSDGQLVSSPATVSLTIAPVNDAPAAGADNFTTPLGTPITITPAELLANDSDLDSTQLTVSVVGGPTNGTLVQNADGSYTYTPDRRFSGTDSFPYVVSDGQTTSSPATVTITVLSKRK